MKIGPKPELPSSAVQAGNAKQQAKAAAPFATDSSAAAAAAVPVTL